MNDSKMQDVLKFMYIRTGDEDEDNVRLEEVMELWTQLGAIWGPGPAGHLVQAPGP